ncbi:MAG: HAMP domain-containing sensor histidine kinase [Deltaproteobacteria bacterium]|nr:HAMP domain-containing sensor histidine kinase [Deltaproteobacteria bacterium]
MIAHATVPSTLPPARLSIVAPSPSTSLYPPPTQPSRVPGPMPPREGRRSLPILATLMVSHGILAVILLGVLSIGSYTVRQIDALIRDLREDQLGAIEEQETLHRAMWNVEVALRHATEACVHSAPASAVQPPITRALAALQREDEHVGPHVGREMRTMGAQYERLAQQSLQDTCVFLNSSPTRAARLRLDEDLTDRWITQSFELHRAMAQREDHARRLGRRALVSAGAITLLALSLATYLARFIARSIAAPLRRITLDAARVGRGDFRAIEPIQGPREVVELADALDHMRSALAAIDSLKQGFLASVSHELRTPLAKIRESLALLADETAGALSRTQRPVLAIAQRACEEEIRLVTTLLDLSRLRAGSPVQRSQLGSVDAVIESALSFERDDAQRRGITVQFTSDEARAHASLDAILLERAVANLVRNAISVSPPQSVVWVTRNTHSRAPQAVQKRSPGAQRWAQIRVEDQGPGVLSEVRDQLFEPFVTRNVQGQQAKVGIGLGLALTREVARAHGGEALLAETSPGGGAAFELWIPLANLSERPTEAS